MFGVKQVDLDRTLGMGGTDAASTSALCCRSVCLHWLVEMGCLGKSVLGGENRRKAWSTVGGRLAFATWQILVIFLFQRVQN